MYYDFNMSNTTVGAHDEFLKTALLKYKRIHCVKKYPIGIHQRWSADGHDKLYKIGFPIWAIVDDARTRPPPPAPWTRRVQYQLN